MFFCFSSLILFSISTSPYGGALIAFLILTLFSAKFSFSAFSMNGLFYLSKSFCLETDSLFLILLLFLNIISCFAAVYTMAANNPINLSLWVFLLGVFCYFFFISSNWLKFYIYFELTLIPILLIILGWGYQSERLKASKAMVLYTIFGALPLLSLILSQTYFSSNSFFSGQTFFFTSSLSNLLTLSVSMAFLIKLPIFGAHMWLPKAHVEAPVIGSMFLAAILLKVGGLGLLKTQLFFNQFVSSKFVISSLAIWSLIFINVLVLQINDMKMIIAFSSVSHMAVGLLALLSATLSGAKIALMVFLAHGFSSAMMFFQSYLSYKKVNSRSILISKSLFSSSGIWVLLWVLACLGMMGAPPTVNLWVEMGAFLNLQLFMKTSIKLLFWGAFLTGAYCFILMSLIFSGNSMFNQISVSTFSKVDVNHLLFYSFLMVGFSLTLPYMAF